MAKIEMDISEYETLKEYQKSLEKSLENERDLKKQIDKLNQEKIDAYESAKMKVVKTVVHRSEDHILTNTTHDLLLHIGNYPSLRYVNPQDIYGMFDDLKTKVVSPEEVTVTFSGLEEIKKELRLELQEEVRNDLENYKKLSKEVDRLRVNLAISTNKVEELEESKERYKKYFDKASGNASTWRGKSQQVYDKLSPSNCNFFNRGKLIKEVLEILKDA